MAREKYRQFVAAGMKYGHREEFYAAEEGRILGTEEFVDVFRLFASAMSIIRQP